MLSPTAPINRASLHPGAGYFIGPRVPHGLAAVVEGLTREVLRHRPEDIYVFAAHHFEKLLELREQYHAEKYHNIREFDDDFNRDFNLWPTKGSRDTRVSPTSGWSLDKETKVFERCGKVPTDMEESPEDVSTDREKRKMSRQTHTKSSSSTRRASRRSTKDKDAESDPRATKIISQMSALRGSNRTILTKDIKQELRKNKLNSGEKGKGKMSDSVERGIRGERRSRTKTSKTDKSTEEEIERDAMTTTGKTSTRRPLKKVRRIETESETETEREIASKNRLGNGYESASREAAAACSGSRSRRPEAAAWPCEHSSERKVSSRALSMDRIRAYVLRKFASTASLEVLRSPTYVEQVQEVIDRAAPIIKEKLEEIRRPRGKRSRSVDFAWNEESLRRCVARDSRRSGDRDEEERGKRKIGNGALEQELSNDARRDGKSEDQSARREEVAPSAECEERRPGRRSAGSGRRSRRLESCGHGDLGLADRVDDDSEHSNKSEYEFGAGRDTLEARLTATQSILEGISMSTSELNGARKVDSAGDERGEPATPSEASDHANVVSLPIVRPPSAKSCKSAAKNGSDSLTLPPISPEAPRSTKKKDELSLPILSAAPNGNQSAKRSQEQDSSKDAEEASTMRDITSDMEDIAVLPEDEEEQPATAGVRPDPMGDHRDVMSREESEDDKDVEEEVLWKDTQLAGKRISDVSLDRDLKEYQESIEARERRADEVYKDSLNVTPEVADIPLRPDSLESDEDEPDKLRDEEDDDGDAVRNHMFDDLKDRLIEIEMAERNIEKALASQQNATCNDEAMGEAGRSTSVEKMDETRKSSGEAEEAASEIRKSMSERRTPNEGEKEEEESINEVQEGSSRENVERSTNEREILGDEGESLNEEEERGESANEVEPSTMIGSEELIREKGSKTQVSTNEAERVPNGVEELMVRRHMKSLESTNTRYKIKNDQTVQVPVREADDKDDATSSDGKSVTANVSSRTTGPESATDEHLTASFPTNGSEIPTIGKTKARKRRETNGVPVTTPLSLKIPFAYVLSEGSPCEIPDSVTTVIIPDGPCPSPVISEIDDLQHGSTYLPTERAAHDYVVEDVSSKNETRQDEDRAEYGIEAFGEYVLPEVTALPVDVNFVHGARGMKPGQDIVIVHQDLDRIKEEGEEEEEDKEDDERGEEESHLEKNDEQAVEAAVGQAEETVKLEDIVEHEDNETNTGMIAEEVSPSCLPESEALPETTESINLTNAGRTLDNLSEENGSSQDIHTTTSSDAKESTASNQSIESSSVGRPIVPELNLDSLQDNTVSSFKMTANGTVTKESNGSPRESDATMSLVEPLSPDERLTMGNRLVLPERELGTPVEELELNSLNFRVQSDVPEADQLYPAEHAEYELLERDLLSSEAMLEDEAKVQEKDVIGSEASSRNAACTGTVSRKKKEVEEWDNEEEIARELIDILYEETQFHAGESSHGRRLEDHEEPAESNLDVVDGTSYGPLSDSVHSISVNRAEEEKDSVLSERPGKLDDEGVSRTEAISELSGHIADSSQENEDEDEAMVNKETKDPELEVEQKERVECNQGASLAESQQDESSAKDNAATNEEIKEPKVEIEEKEHIESSQITSLAESEQDKSSAKDDATANEETEEPKVEVEEKEHIESSQITSLAESEQDKSSAKDDATTNEETEEPEVEVEEKEHIESSQITSLAESEQDKSSAKDDATTNEETEEPKVEVEEKEHIESSQITYLAESEQDKSSAKDDATTNEETEEPKVEVEEKEHIESSQITSLAESEQDKSSAKDDATTNEEAEEPKAEVEVENHIESRQIISQAESEKDESSVKDNAATNEEPEMEVEEKKLVETSQVTPHAESERDESSAKDNAAENEETEEPEAVVEEKKHTETIQIAPLAEFEQDEFLDKNGSHEIPDGKITNERDVVDADIAGNEESREDRQIDVAGVLKSESSESASKVEEFPEKQKENKHEELKDRGKSEEENVVVQEECQEEELNDEGKRERKESIANEEDSQEHMKVQETTKSREDMPKTSVEESEDAEQSETALTESIADDQTSRDTTSGKEEKIEDDLSVKLESVHGPITSAISTQDYHHTRYRTMGTKSSTAETVIAAFGSNTSADEKSLDDTSKIVGNESMTREKDDFYSAIVKVQASRRRLRKDLRSDSVPNDVPWTQGTAATRNEHVLASEDRSSLREGRSGRHRLRREEAVRKTTLSLENAFATSRLQHTGEFHDSVPLPLFDMTHSETDSSDSLDESLDRETEEELTKTDTAKSTTCETTDNNCHDDERRGCSRKSNAFADHSDLPIVMQLLAAGASSHNCHFRINRNSDPDLDLRTCGAKLVEPALDILMLGYPRDDATLQNRYLNFITSVEDVGSNMDYLTPDVATKSATNADDAQPSATFGEKSLREPLALPGTPQGVVIEELTSLDETAGDVSLTRASTATKTSLDTNSSVPLEECALEDKNKSEASPRTNPADKGDTISDGKRRAEEVGGESGDTSTVDNNSRSVGEVGLRAKDASGSSSTIFHDSNGHIDEGNDGKA